MAFIELNEVPYRVLDEYCRRSPASVLASVMPMAPSVGVKVDPARVAELTAKLDQITPDGFSFESGDEEKLPLSYFAGNDGVVSILTCENGRRGQRHRPPRARERAGGF